VADATIAVPLPRGGVAGRLSPGLDDRARPAQRLAAERRRGASNALAQGAPGAVCRLLGGPALLEAISATRSTVDGPAAAAADADPGVDPGLPAFPGSDARRGPPGGSRFAAVFQTGRLGQMVSCSLGGAAPSGAGQAEREPGLGIAAAFQALARGLALGPPFPGAGVFGLAHLGAPDALEAGGAAPIDTPGVGRAALQPAGLAGAPAFHGFAATASDAEPGCGAGVDPAAVPVAIALAADNGIRARHTVLLVKIGSERRGYGGIRRRCRRSENSPQAAEPQSCRPERLPRAVHTTISLYAGRISRTCSNVATSGFGRPRALPDGASRGQRRTSPSAKARNLSTA